MPTASSVPAHPLAPPPPPAAAARPGTAPLTEAELFRRKSLSELNVEHPLNDAFFDDDQTTLRDDAKRALQQDAPWLARSSQTMISVERYCDERGNG